MMEAKFHEEKLGIQQRHDEAIQKVLGTYSEVVQHDPVTGPKINFNCL